jgi:hypothetical protein
MCDLYRNGRNRPDVRTPAHEAALDGEAGFRMAMSASSDLPPRHGQTCMPFVTTARARRALSPSLVGSNSSWKW